MRKELLEVNLRCRGVIEGSLIDEVFKEMGYYQLTALSFFVRTLGGGWKKEVTKVINMKACASAYLSGKLSIASRIRILCGVSVQEEA